MPIPHPHPPLGPERRVGVREVREGQYVQRRLADGRPAGWFRIVEVRWLGVPRRRYYIRFERPDGLRNTLADHYRMAAGSTEVVRDPLTEE